VDALEIQTKVRELIDEYRARCLWFLRADYYPESRALAAEWALCIAARE
jgi:hypothetical protein